MNSEADLRFDCVIIGGGPGGYVSAIRSSQLGLKVLLVEKEKIGGVCLNRGCIPTKALIRNAEVLSLLKRSSEFGFHFEGLRVDYAEAFKRSREVVDQSISGVDFLLKKNRVKLLEGCAEIVSPGEVRVRSVPGDQVVRSRHIVIATGSRVKPLSSVPFDGEGIIGSDEAIRMTELPATLLIVGGGAVGVEFAYLFSAYGVQVTLIETESRILPREDEEIGPALGRAFSKMKIKVRTNCQIGGVEKSGEGYSVRIRSGNREERMIFDMIFVAAGRTPNSDGIGLEEAGIALDRGFIRTNETMETNVPGILAIGDVAGKALLAHTAMAEGVVAAEKIAGKNPAGIDYLSVPNCVYCQPQVASVGLTESAARNRGYAAKTGKFPFRANGKASAVGEREGFVKLVADGESGSLLGAHLIGPDATEQIAELALARRKGATIEDLSLTIHPHPTFSEAVREAADDLLGRAVHIWRDAR